MKSSTRVLLSMICIIIYTVSSSAQQTTTPFDSGTFSAVLAKNDPPREGGTSSGDHPVGGGGGVGDNAILLNLPNDGTMLKKDFVLYWKDVKNTSSEPFTITLTNDDTQKTIFSANTPANEISLNLKEFKLNPENVYAIEVSRVIGTKKSVSKTATFMVADDNMVIDLEGGLSEAPSFKSADSFNKMVMKAFLMEQNALYMEAQSCYLEAIKLANNQRNATQVINMLNAMKSLYF